MLRSSGSQIWEPITFSDWLPTRQQISNAVQLRLETAIHGEDFERRALGGAPATTMRQALGLILLISLTAGLVPSLVGWIQAGRAGTVLPLLTYAHSLAGWNWEGWNLTDSPEVMRETAETLVGLSPQLPVWLAAGLSALGNWINWPLNGLAIWIVYGLGVLIFAKLLGARTTLQQFYAGTGYAVTPLFLLALSPLPCLGPPIALLAWLWSAAVYVQAVRVVSDLGLVRALLAVIGPAAVLSLFMLIGAATLAVSLIRLLS